MPIQPDEEQRIQRLRAALLDLGLDWNRQYRLVDEVTKWRVDYIQPITDEKFQQAEVLVAEIMNS